MLADNFGNSFNGDGFIANGMISRSCFTAFQRQSEQMNCIQPVHCIPSVLTITDISDNALLTGSIDEYRDKPMMIALAVNRRR